MKRTAIVTGGTSGIGLSIVQSLVKENFDVYFIGTNVNKGLRIEKELKLSNTNMNIKFIELDLGNLRAVKSFIDDIKKKHFKLDLLANIAGILSPTREETLDGIEKNFSISYLSAFFMSTELLDLLEKGDNPRIINVSAKPSIILKSKLNFDDINLTENYNGFKASTLAVHAKTVFTNSFANKIKESKITVNSFHPGNIRTDLFRNMPKLFRFIMNLFKPLFDETSKTATEVCLSDSYNGVTGKLIVGNKTHDITVDKEYEEKLWSISENMINSILCI